MTFGTGSELVLYAPWVLWQGYTPFKRRDDGFESHTGYSGEAVRIGSLVQRRVALEALRAHGVQHVWVVEGVATSPAAPEWWNGRHAGFKTQCRKT
jgi:hypothetical protein